MPDFAGLPAVLREAGVDLEALSAEWETDGQTAPDWIRHLSLGEPVVLTPADYVNLADFTNLDVSVLTGAIDPRSNFAIATRARAAGGPAEALPRASALLRVVDAIRSTGAARGERLGRVSRLVDPEGGGRPNATRHQGRVAARFLRRSLGLGRDPIDDLSELIETLEVPVEFSALLPEGHHGFTAWNRTQVGWSAVMLVNAHDLWTVQRYTQAHELGHVLYQDRPEDLTTEVTDEIAEKIASNAVEARAEAFAAELLIPEAGLLQYWKSMDAAGSDRARKVASVMWHFGVSRTAACIALEGAGAVPWSAADTAAVSRVSVGSLVQAAGLADQWEQLQESSASWRPSLWLLEQTSGLFEDSQLPVENYAVAASIEPQAALEELLA